MSKPTAEPEAKPKALSLGLKNTGDEEVDAALEGAGEEEPEAENDLDEEDWEFVEAAVLTHEAAVDAALVFQQPQLRQLLEGLMAISPEVADHVRDQAAAILLSMQEDAEEELAAGESAGAAAAVVM